MNNNKISNDLQIIVIVAVFLLLAFSIFQHRPVYPEYWFPSPFAASAFTILLYVWILSEIANSAWSRKNSRSTNQDKGSYRVVVITTWLAIIVVFTLRSFGIGTFIGNLQYVGLGLLAVGIVLREWAVSVLGKHFTVRVQVHEKARLVTQGPYKYIRHPSYTGSLLILAGLSLAVGTWLGAIFALVVSWIAHVYRIRVEEEALQEAFGSDYGEYKKRTWKLFPGF
jgi:protein-S-isoprenylcysteine O-methyltransferase Ste14